MALITAPGVLLQTAATEAYVCPNDTVTNRVNISLINLDTVLRAVSVWIVPAGQAVSDAYEIIGMESSAAKIRPGEKRLYPFNQTLLAGDKVYWSCPAAADVIVAHIDISEVPSTGIVVDGFTRLYVVNDDGAGAANTMYLPDTLSLAYTVPSNAQVIQMELVVHNNDAASQQAIAVRAVPSGEDSGDSEWIIVSNSASGHPAPGECRVLQLEHFLTGDYGIYWRALNASKVVGRLSLEIVEL